MTPKAEEVKKKSLESELQKLEAAASDAARDQFESFRKDEDRVFDQLLNEANQKRLKKESALRQVEEETLAKLQKEIQRRISLRHEEQLLRKKAEEEARRKAEEERKRQEELRKQEEEKKARAELERRRAEEEARRKAEEERKRREELRKQEEERKAREEAERKRAEEEARRKAEEERKRQEELRRLEEERKRREEEALRLKLEEEARARAEAERKQREEELRQKEEAARKQFEEERARIEQESRKRIEEELRRKQEEQRLLEEKERIRREEQKQRESVLIQEARERERVEREQRIISLIVSATQFLEEGNLENARTEVAKALMNDPANPTALELQRKIDEKSHPPTTPKRETEKIVQEPEETSTEQAISQKPKSRLPVFLIITIVAGALIVSAVLFFQLQKKVFSTTPNIAALPWRSTANIPEDDILGSSLAEEVTRQFEHSDLVNILGFSSAYGLMNRPEDPSQLASSLGYTFILQGSIEHSGDTYKFDLTLRDSLGNTVWENSYAKSLSNLSSLPGQVYSDIMTALQLSSQGADNSISQTIEPNAYFLYLRGKELMHRATKENYENAYHLFHQAAEQDKNFIVADAWKAMAVGLSLEKGIPVRLASREDAIRLAQHAATRLPSSPDGFIALGILTSLDKKYQTALGLFDSAEVRSPNSSSVFLEKAKVWIKTGNFKEALAQLESAFKLSPRDPEILTLLGQTYQLSGNTSEAIWYYETALYFVSDSIQYIAGPFSEAILQDPKLTLTYGDRVIASYRHNIASNPRDYISLYRLARLYQLLGQAQESLTILKLAENILQDEVRQNPENTSAMSHLALTLTRLGKYPEALLFADRATQKDSTDAELKYRVAQVYSMQMYSRKTSSTDEDLKQRCITTLREAVALSFRIDLLLNADFYNMYEHANFKEIIRQPM